ncbi:nitroreductase/quinone reductase family protein [Streptomyces lydicus]
MPNRLAQETSPYLLQHADNPVDRWTWSLTRSGKRGVTVEAGTRKYRATASIPPSEERDRLFARIVEKEPGYGEYQTKTDRVIPVVALHPADLTPTGPSTSVTNWSDCTTRTGTIRYGYARRWRTSRTSSKRTSTRRSDNSPPH